MKKIFLLLFVATFVLFTSCEKDAEPEPYSLATDLENGYWVNILYSDIVLKFDGTNHTVYIICEEVSCAPNFPCIRQEDVFPYTLEDNTISIDGGGYWSIKIEGDILTIDDILINQRTLTFDYSDCE